MRGEPLAAVRSSLHALVDRIKPQDTFGVVAFDDTATVTVPARPVRDHHVPTVHTLIESINAGGSTDRTGGFLLGLSEARRNLGATCATVLLLSDGHANAVITDPVRIGALSTAGRNDRITSSTIGIGAGYDEILLNEIAVCGSGSHRFALTPDDTAVVGEEAGDLLTKAIANAFVRIWPNDPLRVDLISALHAVPRWVEEDAGGGAVLVVPLGDFYAGEERELLLRFDVPGIADLGIHRIAEVTTDFVEVPSLVAQAITWPIRVNVVPGDQAAARMFDPVVTTATLLAEATQAKKDAAQALTGGDAVAASALMTAHAERLDVGIAGVTDATPDGTSLRDRLREERDQLEKLARGAHEMPAGLATKSLVEDYSMTARGRNDQNRRHRTRTKSDF